MGLTFKTRLFAEETAEKKGIWTKTKDAGKWVANLPSRGAHKVYDLAEGKKAGAGKYALGAAGALLGGGVGAGVAGITLKGLKGRLKEAHPDWSDEQVQAEYNKIKKKRLAIGAISGAVLGGAGVGYKGYKYSKRGQAGA